MLETPTTKSDRHIQMRKPEPGKGTQPPRVCSDQIRISTDILVQSKGISHNQPQRTGCRGYLAFDIVHAVEFSRIGRTRIHPYSGLPPRQLPYLTPPRVPRQTSHP